MGLGLALYSGLLVKTAGIVAVAVNGDKAASCALKLCGTWYIYSTVLEVMGLNFDETLGSFGLLALIAMLPALYKRILTVFATYPLAHAFKYASQILPKYTINESNFFTCDGCSPEVATRRKDALMELSQKWKKKYSKCLDFSANLKKMMSDLRFTGGRCFPAFNEVVNSYLDPSMALEKTDRMDVYDIDGNSAMDISGSYGVNVCGYEKYKEFIEEGWAHAKTKGLFLGSLDSQVVENIQMLQEISGQEEVSFHMSGTEAVMAAVRCARWNTKKNMVVTFGGAYHGWWDGMQPVVGNDRIPADVLCLKDMSNLSLAVLQARKSEIAAVLVNTLQCFHLNQSPPSDPVLSTNTRQVGATPGYKEWLKKLRDVCTNSDIVLVFDEVYTGFRLDPRGSQGAYGVNADIVTYGKTLGGGLPVGVVCGPKRLMNRGDPRKVARVNYVIGTFAGHPFVMACMNAFLKWLKKPETIESYNAMHTNIDHFMTTTNASLKKEGYPVQLANWYSVWSMLYTEPGRYHWMLQYYMKDAGINLSWVGTGRLLFSLDWQRSDYDRLTERILVACQAMKDAGWWEKPQTNIKKRLVSEMGQAVMKNLLS